jgi:hypothetical protein
LTSSLEAFGKMRASKRGIRSEAASSTSVASSFLLNFEDDALGMHGDGFEVTRLAVDKQVVSMDPTLLDESRGADSTL